MRSFWPEADLAGPIMWHHPSQSQTFVHERLLYEMATPAGRAGGVGGGAVGWRLVALRADVCQNTTNSVSRLFWTHNALFCNATFLPCDALVRFSAPELSSSALWVRSSAPSAPRCDDALSVTYSTWQCTVKQYQTIRPCTAMHPISNNTEILE